jgi:dephospho-CoA kinase
VLEAIRLIEGGYADLLDEVWLIVCDQAAQRGRLADRGLDAAEADRRMARQAGLLERARGVATRTLDTSGSLEATLEVVDAALAEALAAAARRRADRVG